MIIDKDILQQATNTWGIPAQIEMIKEECLELALALQKLNQEEESYHEKYLNVIDEIADVIIMVEQAQMIFSDTLINKAITFKMQRLEARLAKEERKCEDKRGDIP